MSVVWMGFLASLLAGLLTGVAGIMLATSFFSLLLPAIEYLDATLG